MTKLAIRRLATLLIVCLLTAAPLQAQDGRVPTSLNGLDGFVEQVMKDWHVPGLAVAIVKDNNLMFMTAGVLIERVSGSTWEEFVRRRILDPLGMKPVITNS